ncbi:MAG: ABC transporter ATP-binding protein/permease [Alphaproteobacteria bacterium]|nr:ABC transporter ATP-binding protein/permease [Alphaproteobacteria bacterium]MBU1563328.1 ABC transporter ATP-binding protein/permease [Alphaproteobacteria bacterium]MBU2302051.1 ABC transporter ATP-binding protein/permease [Alphaproteobacteria bacterium]MBU2367307.1 ABC transporter ATP-binding protein/permease [Alphaproteobacteria bacterium]
MFNRVISYFDHLYSPTALAENRQPPMGLRPFVGYFIAQFRAAFIIRILLVSIGSIADALMPVFVGLIVGMLATTNPGDIFDLHGQTFLWMIVVVVLVRPLTFLLDTLIRNHAIVPNLVDLVRWQSHWHVIRQSWTFFQNDFAGRVANKIIQAGEAIEIGVNLTIDAAWYALVFVVVAIIVLAQLDPVLLVPIGVWLLLYAVLFSITMPLIARYSEELSESKSVMTGRIVDSYTNIQTLKTFSTGGHEDRYVADSIDDHAISFRKLMRVFTYMWSTLFLLNAGLVVSVTWLALTGWNEGALTAAAVATAIPFALQIMNMSGWILEIGSSIFRQIGNIRDSMETIAQPLTMLDAPEAKALAVTRGELTYDNVSFNYWRGKEGSVIDAFNLTVAPGEKIGLVGRSGSGKSTLVNLALRMFDVQDGAIRIDGQDVRNVTQESVRAAIGLVSQDTSLLHRSVRENLKYGRQNATDEEMMRAAEQARIHDVIMGLVDPKGNRGYDAHVGERGVKLSGGQRQRVAIARVLLKNAPILVLDEATSALDSEVEAAIQEQLTTLMQGKTVIAIAHRLSTIAAMDRLVVLEQGQIVEEGTHAQLLASGGHYAQLWERQSGGFLDLEAS